MAQENPRIVGIDPGSMKTGVAYITGRTLYPFSPGNTYIALIVYTSWKINDNYCILSQIEYKWYGETWLSKTLKQISDKEKYFLSISQSIKFIFWLSA